MTVLCLFWRVIWMARRRVDFPDPEEPVIRESLELLSFDRISGASGWCVCVVDWWVGRRPKGRRALRDRAVGVAWVWIGVGAWIGRVDVLVFFD